MVKKETPVEQKNNSRKLKRSLQRSIKEEWSKTDTDIHLAQQVFYAVRKKQRMDQGFESKKAARERQQKINVIIENVGGDIDKLLDDVNQWPHSPINWSQMAKKYKIKRAGSANVPQNGGQIL